MTFNQDHERLAREWGIHTLAQDYLPDDFRANFALAMDAQTTMVTPASGGIPAMFTYYVDPKTINILQAPNKGAEILGEAKKGDWTTTTALFPVVENVGEVAAYGDRNTNGRSDANAIFPQRQSFHFQTVIDYGDREVAMAGEAKLDWISQKQTSAAKTLNKFADAAYHYGINGLQNYGLQNDPSLAAALTPTTKSEAGLGTSWGSVGNYASPNEIFNDWQIMFNALVNQANGYITAEDALTFVCDPSREAALLSTNSFGLSAYDMIRKAFKKVRVVTSPRYNTGGGHLCQLIADEVEAVKTGVCAFTEKMRDFPVVRLHSSFEQKKMGGTWGAVILQPFAIVSMLGI